jgi:hypothetical protein
LHLSNGNAKIKKGTEKAITIIFYYTKNAILFDFHAACMEFPSDPCIRISPEFSAFLAGLDQNARGNAGAQSNPPSNLHCGFCISLCQFDCYIGKRLNLKL